MEQPLNFKVGYGFILKKYFVFRFAEKNILIIELKKKLYSDRNVCKNHFFLR